MRNYSFECGCSAVSGFYRTYGRATEVIRHLYGITPYDVTEWFRKDQKRWRKFKKAVWYINKRLHDFKSTGKDFWQWFRNAPEDGVGLPGRKHLHAQLKYVMESDYTGEDAMKVFDKRPLS